MLLSPKTFRGTLTRQARPFYTYPSIFLWDIVKLNLSLLLDSGVLSNLHSSSIFSRESGLLFCKREEGDQVRAEQKVSEITAMSDLRMISCGSLSSASFLCDKKRFRWLEVDEKRSECGDEPQKTGVKSCGWLLLSTLEHLFAHCLVIDLPAETHWEPTAETLNAAPDTQFSL